ncbi:MAG: DUF4173 domain-containing protein [Firmicutes bacterium]|nr:DUF4173 domain-containing protein [Bacillota bacterium]
MDQKGGRIGASDIVKKYDYFIIFLLSFLYVRWELLWRGSGVSVTLFALLFCGFTALRMGPVNEQRRKAARPWLAVTAVSALQAAVWDDTPVSWFNFLFLSICAMYWMMVLSGRRLTDRLDGYVLADLFCQMVRVPFGNMGRSFAFILRFGSHTKAGNSTAEAASNASVGAEAGAVASSGASRRNALRSIGWVAGALLMAAPLLLVVMKLLSAADADFLRIMGTFTDIASRWLDELITVNVMELLLELVIALPVAAYLFGAVWGNLRPDEARGWTEKDRVDRELASLQMFPRIAVYTAVGLFLTVYLLFLGIQAGHLLSALGGGLPGTATYSSFAREGFFELCAVCAINLGIMAISWLLCARREGRIPRGLSAMVFLLSLQTVLLAVTAMVKMGLYIQAYGLTRLRVYTFWFMIWLLLVFLVLAVARLRTIPAAKLLTVISVVMFLTLGWANVDGIVVRENVARYEGGRMSLEELDVTSLASLSANGAMELLGYSQEDAGGDDRKAALQQEIRQTLRLHSSWWTVGEWEKLTWSKLRFQWKWNAGNKGISHGA